MQTLQEPQCQQSTPTLYSNKRFQASLCVVSLLSLALLRLVLLTLWIFPLSGRVVIAALLVTPLLSGIFFLFFSSSAFFTFSSCSVFSSSWVSNCSFLPSLYYLFLVLLALLFLLPPSNVVPLQVSFALSVLYTFLLLFSYFFFFFLWIGPFIVPLDKHPNNNHYWCSRKHDEYQYNNIHDLLLILRHCFV